MSEEEGKSQNTNFSKTAETISSLLYGDLPIENPEKSEIHLPGEFESSLELLSPNEADEKNFIFFKQTIKKWVTDYKSFVKVEDLDENGFVLVFSVGTSREDLHVCQVFCDQDWMPMFFVSEDALMTNIVERVNLFIQRRDGVTVEELAKEMTIAFKNAFEITETVVETPKYSPYQRPFVKTFELILGQVQSYQRDNANFLTLDVDDVRDFEMDLNYVDKSFQFTLVFDTQWDIVSIIANDESEENQSIVAMANSELLKLRPKSMNDFLNSLLDLVDALKGGDLIDPTPKDWNIKILPFVTNFLLEDGQSNWQIEEHIGILRSRYLSLSDNIGACKYIRNQVFGNNVPRQIRKFLIDKKPEYLRFDGWICPPTATLEAKEILLDTFEMLKEIISPQYGFTAKPFGKNLFHWGLQLFDFPFDSTIGEQLFTYTAAKNEKESSGKIKPVDITLEIRFPENYPHEKPYIRLIKPLFQETQNIFDFSDIEEYLVVPEKYKSLQNWEVAEPDEDNSPSMRNNLTVSQAIQGDWRFSNRLHDVFFHIRRKILESNSLTIDMTSDIRGIPTDSFFWKEYYCLSSEEFEKKRSHLEMGGKIYLPVSALNEIMTPPGKNPLNYSYENLRMSQGNSPYVFELALPSGRKTFCGVHEFIAPEGYVVLPQWMMDELDACTGMPIQVRKVRLTKGIHVKLQPHEVNCTRSDLKPILEWVLRRFVALTTGDTIHFEFNKQEYCFNVIETLPTRAVAITDQDVSVEFMEPLIGSFVEEETSNKEDSDSVDDVEGGGDYNQQRARRQSKGTELGNFNDVQGVEGVDFITCKNCKNRIPPTTFWRHEMHCERQNKFCETCQIVVKRSEYEKHEQEEHGEVHCEKCGEPYPKFEKIKHDNLDCTRRNVQCKYCELQMPYNELWDHEVMCGAMTEPCGKCGQRITRDKFEAHVYQCDGTVKKNPQLRRPSLRQSLFVCPTCQSPFENLDDLQVHILISHELETEPEPEPEPTPDTDPFDTTDYFSYDSEEFDFSYEEISSNSLNEETNSDSN